MPLATTVHLLEMTEDDLVALMIGPDALAAALAEQELQERRCARLCVVTAADAFGNHDRFEHDECPIHGRA